MRWIKKEEEWWINSEQIDTFIGMTPINGGLIISGTPKSWDGFQEFIARYSNCVIFEKCQMPTDLINFNEANVTLKYVIGAFNFTAVNKLIIEGSIDPMSKCSALIIEYQYFEQMVNRKNVPICGSHETTLMAPYRFKPPGSYPSIFNKCSEIGPLNNLIIRGRSFVDLTGIHKLGNIQTIYIWGNLSNCWGLIGSNIREIKWIQASNTTETNEFLTRINEFKKHNSSVGFMAIWQFSHTYPTFTHLLPKE